MVLLLPCIVHIKVEAIDRVTLALATKINSLRGSWSYKREVHAIEFKIEKSKELRVVCGYVSKSSLE